MRTYRVTMYPRYKTLTYTVVAESVEHAERLAWDEYTCDRLEYDFETEDLGEASGHCEVGPQGCQQCWEGGADEGS